MDYYENTTAFFEEVTAVSKEILRCYLGRTIVTTENEELYTIRGRVLRARDLKNLVLHQFTQEEIDAYERIQSQNRQALADIRKKAAVSASHKVILPFMYLVNVLHCNEFEFLILCQLLACEFDAEQSKIFQLIMNDENSFTPSLEVCLCLFTLDEQKKKALLTEEYQRIRLLSLFLENDFAKDKIRTNLTQPLRLNRRIFDFSVNMNSENRYVGGALTMIWPWSAKEETIIGQEDVADRIGAYCVKAEGKKIFCLIGEAGAGKHFQLRQFAKKSRINILLVNVRALPKATEELKEVMHQLLLECMIRKGVIAFEGLYEDRQEDFAATLEQFFEELWQFHSMAFLLLEKKPASVFSQRLQQYFINIDLNDDSIGHRLLLWEHFLGSDKRFGNINAESMAVRFEFTPGKIVKSIEMATKMMYWEGRASIDEKLLTKACYSQVSHRLSDKAVKLEVKYGWDDLVLEEEQLSLLKEACAHVRYKHLVYDTWGFSAKNHYGKGVSMLFYGPPGTGKTMTAQVMANELNMEIYKVDLSTILSKYIGETEKNLNVIFDEVKKSNSILFFDEADALFGKRTETKEANDKYANAETSYLLQKMEEYSGIVILATNYMQNFDEAYKRRIKFMIHFSFPDAQERKRLWELCFAKEAPRENIDYDFLGERFELTGSHIKNVVINAAFMAAAKGHGITMEDIILSLKHENEKYGKILTKEEVGEYFYLL